MNIHESVIKNEGSTLIGERNSLGNKQQWKVAIKTRCASVQFSRSDVVNVRIHFIVTAQWSLSFLCYHTDQIEKVLHAPHPLYLSFRSVDYSTWYQAVTNYTLLESQCPVSNGLGLEMSSSIQSSNYLSSKCVRNVLSDKIVKIMND